MGVAVGILLLCALELEICLGGHFTPPLPADVAKKPLPGEGLKALLYKNALTSPQTADVWPPYAYKYDALISSQDFVKGRDEKNLDMVGVTEEKMENGKEGQPG